MSHHTEARNELETKLLDAQDGRITSEELLEVLLPSQVYMPVQEEKAAVLNVQAPPAPSRWCCPTRAAC